MLIKDFAEAIAIIGQHLHGSVTSWGRTAAHNISVGGTTPSAHESWRGADMVYDELPPFEHADVVARSHGLLMRREADHDHYQPLDWRKEDPNA